MGLNREQLAAGRDPECPRNAFYEGDSTSSFSASTMKKAAKQDGNIAHPPLDLQIVLNMVTAYPLAFTSNKPAVVELLRLNGVTWIEPPPIAMAGKPNYKQRTWGVGALSGMDDVEAGEENASRSRMLGMAFGYALFKKCTKQF